MVDVAKHADVSVKTVSRVLNHEPHVEDKVRERAALKMAVLILMQKFGVNPKTQTIFYAHIGGMDLLARALINAVNLIKGEKLSGFVDDRCSGWTSGLGAKMLKGQTSLDEMASASLDKNLSPEPKSGRQEYLEDIVILAVK